MDFVEVGDKYSKSALINGHSSVGKCLGHRYLNLPVCTNYITSDGEKDGSGRYGLLGQHHGQKNLEC